MFSAHTLNRQVHEHQFADAPSFARATAYLHLFGIARAIQDLSIRSTECLVAEACQMSCLGQNRVKKSYERKRWQSLVLQL